MNRKEEAIIQRKRAVEEARKERIFNAKTRLIGIDATALEEQARERRRMMKEEERRSDMFDRDRVKADLLSLEYERRQKEEKRRLEQDLNRFRFEEQGKIRQREWDLNDPLALQRQLPIRCGDTDPRLGPSSLQVFGGEDLRAKERKRLQQDQMRNWSLEQQNLKRDSKQIEEEANTYYQNLRKMEDYRWTELNRLLDEAKYANNKAQSEYNMNLAICRAKNKMEEKTRDETDKMTEIMNNLNGDLLTENPAQAISYGPRKVIPDRWKGLQDEQRASIKYDLIEQMRKKQLETGELKEIDKAWEAVTLKNMNDGLLKERENERLEAEMKRKLAEENLSLAKEQSQRNEYLEHCVYTNPIGNEYFSNFNTTTR
ncbi:DgyrCDS4279 [Dimorphilus gyrociliatus]|uniref:DgyrCDS4279 n=1 Tax=Dimorphilus gyrociliatus TaxID=2664684 RepID=A0A7I8VL38_9ANNE|nr:DgyrCDS4279 [Dimorphilus gyrociliatus]